MAPGRTLCALPSVFTRVSAWHTRQQEYYRTPSVWLKSFSFTPVYARKSRTQISSRKPWTQEEDAWIVRLRDERQTFRQMQGCLPGRSREAIRLRLRAVRHRLQNPKWYAPFTLEERQQINSLRARGLSWEDVHRHYPDRNETTIHTIVHSKPPQPMNEAWSDDETAQLRHLRNECKLSWIEVGRRMPNRTLNALKTHYTSVTPKGERIQVLGHRELTAAEHEQFATYRQQGHTLTQVAKLMGRSWNTLRGLDHEGFVFGPRLPRRQRFAEGEDEQILALKAIGKSWKEIASHVRGRTVRALSLRYADLTGRRYKSRGALLSRKGPKSDRSTESDDIKG